MNFLPRSRKARTRLMLLSVIAPVVAVAVGLALWGMRDSISLFYTPSQADAAKPRPGKAIQLGGLVTVGSVVKHPDGRVEFSVQDKVAVDRVLFKGALPDLFREGQGIVADGSYRADGVFMAKVVLAKHDETYMPKQLADALKEQGEWRGDGQVPPSPVYGRGKGDPT